MTHLDLATSMTPTPKPPRSVSLRILVIAVSVALILLASRSVNVETGQAKHAEYQLFFSVSCTEFYYYDLVTSLTPTLERVLADHPTKQTQVKSVAGLNIPVKAGELIGRIGGQT